MKIKVTGHTLHGQRTEQVFEYTHEQIRAVREQEGTLGNLDIEDVQVAYDLAEDRFAELHPLVVIDEWNGMEVIEP